MNNKMRKVICFLIIAGASAGVAQANKTIKIEDYVGGRIESCINNRVKSQDTKQLVEPFRHLTEGTRWQTEFIGKWMLGAIGSYRYNHDAELLQKIKDAAYDLMSTQREDGYMGNYQKSNRLTNWDIWGRKYTSLALLDYYRLTGDKKALKAVEKLIDGLIAELKDRNMDIATTGLYRGMPSCSILEPVMYLYDCTKEKRYLDFAKGIAAAIEKPGSTQLVTKALEGVPVAHRFPFPSHWWSFENGHKAYEMMSCYVGLMELGKVTGEGKYLTAAEAAARNILDTEINVAGSGAAFECWYDGKSQQTIPAYHTMETCVTFTWMQLLDKLWQQTGNSKYADELERTMYNALMASLRSDGNEISKYSPLEGRRQPGEEQCGLPINCCNANGPRAFALIPDFALRVKSDTVFVNLYTPLKGEIEIGKSAMSIEISNNFPRTGKNKIEILKPGKEKVVLALRIPGWCGGKYDISLNGRKVDAQPVNGYAIMSLEKGSNVISTDYNLVSKVEKLNGMQALTRGPLVFARDSRYCDGDIDECGIIKENENGEVDIRFPESSSDFAWITAEVPMVLGTDLENPENASGRMVRFCDFGSAGNDWSRNGRYRVWIVSPIHAMSQPYHKY
jgi:hypothetical protein